MEDNITHERYIAEYLVPFIGWAEAMEFALELRWESGMTHIICSGA